jgi:hypothetical protein
MAENLVDIACSQYPNSLSAAVSAAKELRSAVEPEVAEATNKGGKLPDVAREILALMVERGKHMQFADI